MKKNMNRKLWSSGCVILILALVISQVFAEKENDAYLLSDLYESRKKLEDKGISFEAVLTTEYVKKMTRGGTPEDDGFLGNVDLTAEIDVEKVGWWSNGTFSRNRQASRMCTAMLMTASYETPRSRRSVRAFCTAG